MVLENHLPVQFLKIHHVIQSALSVFMSCTVQHKSTITPAYVRSSSFWASSLCTLIKLQLKTASYIRSLQIMSNSNESYIREHKLKQLMEFLMEQLLNKKPSNPEKYLIKILERRQALLAEKPKTVRIALTRTKFNSRPGFHGPKLISPGLGPTRIEKSRTD